VIGVLSIKGEAKKLKEFQTGIKTAFTTVREELEEHLEAINHSTREIQSIYDYLNELDAKIDKLNERIDEIQIIVSPVQEERFSVQLTNREQEVFLVLYSEERSNSKDIGKKLGFTEEMVNKYVYNLISKGIPIMREYNEKTLYYTLDLKFRDLQAKRNILNINETISKEILTERTL